MDRGSARDRENAADGHILNHRELYRLAILRAFTIYRLACPHLQQHARLNGHRASGRLIRGLLRIRRILRILRILILRPRWRITTLWGITALLWVATLLGIAILLWIARLLRIRLRVIRCSRILLRIRVRCRAWRRQIRHLLLRLRLVRIRRFVGSWRGLRILCICARIAD